MRITRTALIHGLLAAANHERERRRAAEETQVAEARVAFYTQLDEMAARRRAVLAVQGCWHEPTEEERAESLRQLDAWFAERYGQAGYRYRAASGLRRDRAPQQ
jgi:hypothetical protein